MRKQKRQAVQADSSKPAASAAAAVIKKNAWLMEIPAGGHKPADAAGLANAGMEPDGKAEDIWLPWLIRIPMG